jgi:copper chaperone CopZ
MSTRTYTVEGMTCGHCAQAVTAEVTKLGFVTDVTVDVPAKTVAVSGDPIDDAAVAAAVTEAGYTLVG